MEGICGYSFHDELAAEERMVEREVANRILGRRQYLAELGGEMFPGIAAPEVICPKKSTLQQIVAQAFRIFRSEVSAANLRHHDERALIELRIREPDDQMVGLALPIETDPRLGELRQANREVDVGARIVDEPPAAIPHVAVGERHPAEVERSVEALWCRSTEVGAESAAATLCGDCPCTQGSRQSHRERRGEAPSHESYSMPPGLCLPPSRLSAVLRSPQSPHR